jgi:cysteine/O-acetylserine efflux protein
MVNLYPFLAYVVVTTFTPGPNNVMAMSNAMHHGYRRTLGFLAGMTAGFFLVMLACGILNAVLASRLPQVRFWLNLLGAAYMIYLAVHILRSGAMEDSPAKRDLNSFTAGFGLQFLNLKVILYGVTVYAMFITPTYHQPVTVSLFALVLAAVGFIAISCWALGGNIFRQTLRQHHRLFNFAMAGLLIYTAIAALLPHA